MPKQGMTYLDMRVLDIMRETDRPAPWSMSDVARICGISVGSIQHVVERGNVFTRGERYGSALRLYLKDELQEVSATC